MKKNNDNRYKILSESYTKAQILAVVLFFFRKIDDIDFSIIEDIIRRKMGFSCGKNIDEKPLHESIGNLSGHIVISKKEVNDKKTIYLYEAPSAKGVERSTEESEKYFSTLGITCQEELYRTIENICNDSLELTLRRLSVDPELSNINNYVEGKCVKPASRKGLIKAKRYVLSEKGIQKLTYEEKLRELHKSMSIYELTGNADDILLEAKETGYITKSSVTLTEKGRVYLLSKDYEKEVQNIINLLYGVGCAGNFLVEYITHIYIGELNGFYSFVSKLNEIDYLKYCKKMGYNDLMVEPVSDSKDHGARVYPRPYSTNDKK